MAGECDFGGVVGLGGGRGATDLLPKASSAYSLLCQSTNAKCSAYTLYTAILVCTVSFLQDRDCKSEIHIRSHLVICDDQKIVGETKTIQKLLDELSLTLPEKKNIS